MTPPGGVERSDATPDAYFAERWGSSDDPWEHGSRWYEARKYALTAAAAPNERYGRAFEPGCGAGFLSLLLASRADHLLSMERATQGVSATTRRCADLPNVEVALGRIPQEWPDQRFDLIVLSEVLYYLSDDDLDAALACTRDSLAPGGHVVAVHYRRSVTEHVRLGDEVHERLRAAFPSRLVHHLEEDFVLEVLTP